MGQPSTSAQVRAVALRESVASLPATSTFNMTEEAVNIHERMIIERSERFADYIENGVQDAS
jgi:hypothetical protein